MENLSLEEGYVRSYSVKTVVINLQKCIGEFMNIEFGL